MKALTVRQPYAWAIAAGHKTAENRSWPTPHRGPLAIHAGRAWHREGAADPRVLDAFRSYLMGYQLERDPRCQLDPAEHPDRLHFGAVVATAELVDCHHDTGCCRPWGDPGAWHWVLDDVRPLDVPLPATGRLGLWVLQAPPCDPEYAVTQAVASGALEGAPPPDPEWRRALLGIATGELDADDVIRAEIERAKRGGSRPTAG